MYILNHTIRLLIRGTFLLTQSQRHYMVRDDTTLSRRRYTKALGATATVGLAGCLGEDEPEDDWVPMDMEEWPPDNIEGEISTLNWFDPWAQYAIDNFPDEHGVSMSNTGFGDPSEWYTQLEADNPNNVDNITATGPWVERAVENDFLHEVPVERLPAWDHISDEAKELSPWEIDGSTYGVPWAVYYYGVAYNEEVFDEAPTSWDVLWDPEYEGQIVMSDFPDRSCMVAALYTGQDPHDPDDFEEIKEALIQQKPLLLTYWGDGETAQNIMANEEAVVGHLLDGRAYGAYLAGGPVRSTVPEEGAMMYTDMKVIPKGATNLQASTAFMNWAAEPEHAAKLTEEVGYIPATDVGDRMSDEAMERSNYPWPEDWNLIQKELLSAEVRERYDEIWTEVQAA